MYQTSWKGVWQSKIFPDSKVDMHLIEEIVWLTYNDVYEKKNDLTICNL
jgi:hypothetical protein